MHKDNWDDLRFILAVADAGSVSSAARKLGVNHATVLRRIAAFESRGGARVFDRGPAGYVVASDRHGVIDAAREVETAVLAVERLMRGAAAPLRGEVRVTSTDSFCQYVLPRAIAHIASAAPDLSLTVLCSNDHMDFARLSADVTVRPAITLDSAMFGEQVAMLGFGVFASKGAPDRWLGLAGPISRSRPAEWLATQVPANQMAQGADSFMVLRELALAGLGRAILPLFLGYGPGGLSHLKRAMPVIEVPVWVASHSDLADSPRNRATRLLLADALGGMADWLRTGRGMS